MHFIPTTGSSHTIIRLDSAVRPGTKQTHLLSRQLWLVVRTSGSVCLKPALICASLGCVGAHGLCI